jgi:two-component SAPR family response regulator
MPLALLRLLVACGPEGIRQDLLAEQLWPDSDGDVAQRALKTTVYRLRRLLGSGEAVSHQLGRVALDRRVAFVDAWAVSRLLDRVEAAGAPDGDVRRRALELYRGDLFGPEGDDPQLAPARDALRGRVRRLLQPERA